MPPKAKKTKPDLAKPIASNTTEAKATDSNIMFEWRGHQFVVDILAVKYATASFSLRVAANEQLPYTTRLDAATKVMEAAVGQEQLLKALELEPEFFENEAVFADFFNRYTEAMHGASVGESQAS
jgi:hypothetical protein